LFGLILLVNALIGWGFMSLHHWLAYAAAGTVMGASIALLWFLGKIQQTAEFWRGTGPLWMRFLFGDPSKHHLIKYSKRYKCHIGKLGQVESLVFGILGTLLLIYIDRGLYFSAAIMFLITWILCVYLSEMYFRRMYSKHRFTRIREDPDV
jgi:hypothetical protein